MKGRKRPERSTPIADHLDSIVFHWIERHEFWLERDARGTYIMKVMLEDGNRWLYLTDLRDWLLGEEYEAWRFSLATIRRLLTSPSHRGSSAPRAYVESRDEEGRPLKIGFEA